MTVVVVVGGAVEETMRVFIFMMSNYCSYKLPADKLPIVLTHEKYLQNV